MEIAGWFPFDDADEATTFRNLCDRSVPYTVINGAKADTDANGTAPYATSLLLDGVDDALNFASSDLFKFGTQDFTIAVRYRPIARLDSYPTIIGCWQTYGVNGGFALFDRHQSLSTKFAFSFNGSFPFMESTTVVANGTIYELMICREGTNWYFFVNGALEDTATSSAAMNFQGGMAYLGRGGDNADTHVNARISDLLVIKGLALHTASYTPASRYMMTASGVVHDASGGPAQRTIQAHLRDYGQYLGGTVSDASTGAYSISLPRMFECTVTALDDAAGTLYNDQILRVQPA